jgi:hypothetical protein
MGAGFGRAAENLVANNIVKMAGCLFIPLTALKILVG